MKLSISQNKNKRKNKHSLLSAGHSAGAGKAGAGMICLAALAAMSVLFTLPASADSTARYRFDIAAGQSLSQALRNYGQVSGQEIIFTEDLVAGLKAVPLNGEYTADAALNQLLKDTGLMAERSPSGALMIRKPQNARTSLTSSDTIPMSEVRTGTRGSGQGEDLRFAQAEDQNKNGRMEKAQNKNSSDSAATEAEKPGVQEIVVTAQRREERLIDVPVSVTVLKGDNLDAYHGQGVAEALNRVPGVINAVGGGTVRAGSPAGTVIIRGVAPIVGAGTTAYYLDSVPWGFVNSTLSPDANAYDLERVEVLRGPQGTLYGASALNGVVRVLTHEPDLNKFEFKARTSISETEGGGENYRGDAALNIPIVEGALAVRGVVGFQGFGGWLDNVNEKNANDTRVDNYRLRIAAEPTDRLSLGLLAWISRTDVGAPSNSPNGETRPSTLDERATLDFDLYGFNVGYDFDGFTVTSSTSHIDFENTGRFDYRPFTGADRYQNFIFASEVFAQEVALSSTGEGNWRWSLGAIYRDAEDYNMLLRTEALTGAISPGYLAPIIDTRTSRSVAVFGEATRLLFDGQLELTAGLRQFHDETRFDEVSNRFIVGGVPLAGLIHSTGEFDHLTPRLVAAWHSSPESTLYASYAEGFRSGISQSGDAGSRGYPAADPDELTNYEIGYKASAWGGRVNFETALFYIDWQNVQQSLSIILDAANRIWGGAFTNSGSASGFGLEAGVSAEVIDGLTLSGNFSWNELELDEAVFDPGTNPALPPTLIFPRGGRLIFSPEYTVAAAVDYIFPLKGGFHGHFSVSANYMPEYLAGTANLPEIAEETLSARASFALEAPDHWSASLFVENLTNEEGIVYDQFAGFTTPPHVWDTYQRPRTFGVQLQYRY